MIYKLKVYLKEKKVKKIQKIYAKKIIYSNNYKLIRNNSGNFLSNSSNYNNINF